MSYADAIKDNSRQTAPTKPAHSGQKPRPKATEADTFPTLQAASAENTLEQALSPKNAVSKIKLAGNYTNPGHHRNLELARHRRENPPNVPLRLETGLLS